MLIDNFSPLYNWGTGFAVNPMAADVTTRSLALEFCIGEKVGRFPVGHSAGQGPPLRSSTAARSRAPLWKAACPVSFLPSVAEYVPIPCRSSRSSLPSCCWGRASRSDVKSGLFSTTSVLMSCSSSGSNR